MNIKYIRIEENKYSYSNIRYSPPNIQIFEYSNIFVSHCAVPRISTLLMTVTVQLMHFLLIYYLRDGILDPIADYANVQLADVVPIVGDV